MKIIAITNVLEETFLEILTEIAKQAKKQGHTVNEPIILRVGPLNEHHKMPPILKQNHLFSLQSYDRKTKLVNSIYMDIEDALYILDTDVTEAISKTDKYSLCIHAAHALKTKRHVLLASGLHKIYWECWQEYYKEITDEPENSTPTLITRELLHPTFLNMLAVDRVLAQVLDEKIVAITDCVTVRDEHKRTLYTIQVRENLYVDVMELETERSTIHNLMMNDDGSFLYDYDGKTYPDPEKVCDLTNDMLEIYAKKVIDCYRKRQS